MKHAWMLAAVLMAAAGDVPAARPAPAAPPRGTWQLTTDGIRFTLEAREASMREILDELQLILDGRLSFRRVADRRITLNQSNVTLDTLLGSIGLNYTLTYVQGDDGQLNLEGGSLSQAAKTAAAPGGTSAGAAAARAALARGPILDKLLAASGGVDPRTEAGVIYRAPYPLSLKTDGDVNDWPADLPWQRVSLVAPGQDPAAAATNKDSAFDVAVAADTNTMFMALKITDDQFSATNFTGRPGSDDAVRLMVSGPTNLEMTVLRNHVFQNTTNGLQPARVQHVAFGTGARAVIQNADDGWTVEVAMPLQAFGTNAGPTSAYGFNVVLTDRDASDTNATDLSWRSAAGPGATGNGQLQFIDVTR